MIQLMVKCPDCDAYFDCGQYTAEDLYWLYRLFVECHEHHPVYAGFVNKRGPYRYNRMEICLDAKTAFLHVVEDLTDGLAPCDCGREDAAPGTGQG